MSIIGGETIGTALLILLGDGVVAAVLLNKSKAQNSGWIVITFGWGMAVMVGVYAVGQFTGAHLNPAVTLGFWVAGGIDGGDVPKYLIGELLGAFIGAALVLGSYWDHFKDTEDPGLKLAVFSTGPAIRNYALNLFTEIVGTFVLVFGVLAISRQQADGGYRGGGLLVGLLVFSIGLSLGGPTGYAINPARDLGPRIVHALLPVPGKGPSDWAYAWIPVVGPLIGGALGGALYHWWSGSRVSAMKKLINAPDDVVREALRGMEAAHGDRLRVSYDPTYIVRADAPVQGKVGIISGGGSGHEPMHGGFVGPGMLDAACPGEVFTSPTPDQMLEATKAVNGGAGVLHIVKNYTGDVLNFEMAADLAKGEGIEVEAVVTNDDVAVQDSLYTAGRRGVGITVIVEKICGAAAEEGKSLAEVAEICRKVNGQGRTMGMALTACITPRSGEPSFELARGRDGDRHRHPR